MRANPPEDCYVLVELRSIKPIRAALRAAPGARLTIDLAGQSVLGPDGEADRFEIDSFRKDCLLKGVDEINLTLGYEKDIARFEDRRRSEESWL
jgi:3-isopropylmalate/(R)-2-methylmalate dehydratase small subunit